MKLTNHSFLSKLPEHTQPVFIAFDKVIQACTNVKLIGSVFMSVEHQEVVKTQLRHSCLRYVLTFLNTAALCSLTALVAGITIINLSTVQPSDIETC